MARVASHQSEPRPSRDIDRGPPATSSDGMLERYRFGGMGLGSSSQENILTAAVVHQYKGRSPADLLPIINLATQFEATAAHGYRVGLQDLATIANGGAVETRTMASGVFDYRCVDSDDPAWISRLALIAINPMGQSHDVGDLLPRFIHHSRARSWIARINPIALQAAEAWSHGDVLSLGSAVREYVQIFQEASDGRYVNPDVRRLSLVLKESLGERLVAVKPPGAGAASSAAVLLIDEEAREEALRLCRAAGWVAAPVVPTAGLLYEQSAAGCTYSAPLRLDFVGLADLSVNAEIAADGLCFGVAIEPREKLVITPTPAGS